jgi:hypothetical protein
VGYPVDATIVGRVTGISMDWLSWRKTKFARLEIQRMSAGRFLRTFGFFCVSFSSGNGGSKLQPGPVKEYAI